MRIFDQTIEIIDDVVNAGDLAPELERILIGQAGRALSLHIMTAECNIPTHTWLLYSAWVLVNLEHPHDTDPVIRMMRVRAKVEDMARRVDNYVSNEIKKKEQENES